MIIKGKARAGSPQLSAYLVRQGDNERIEVREIRGTVATDIAGAMDEMAALAAGTRGGRPLYHAMISPAPDRPLTPAQLEFAVDSLEKSLGFSGQPRIVVVHEKEGREHIHVVWSRIDVENSRAISDSWNYMRHEQVSRDLERAFGHERVQGVLVELDGRQRPERTPELAEIRQAERAGINKVEVAAELTEIWRTTDNGREFRIEIEYAGYLLARGDRRSFVVLDPAGEVHAVARRIEGARTKDVREKLSDIDIERLPTVSEARAVLRGRVAELRQELERDHQFDTAALESSHRKEIAAQEQRRMIARTKELLFDRIREKMDAHLGKSLYSHADYVSMSQSARKHIADKVRLRGRYMKGVAARYWAEKVAGWQSNHRARDIARMEREHQRVLSPLKRAERRLEQTGLKPKSAPDDSPRPQPRTRQERERDDIHPTRELTDGQRASLDRAIDRTLSKPEQAPKERESDRAPGRGLDPGGGGRER